MTLLDLDYRDLTGTFDKLVSIEMIEAVDWRDHDRFFETCAGLLGPDGNASLQAIVIADESFERPGATTRLWRADVDEHAREVTAMGLGTEFRRLRDLYLAYCEAAFLKRHVSDVQVVLAEAAR